MSDHSSSASRVSPLLLVSALASSIGSFLFGFDTAVIAGTTASLREVFSLNESQLGFAVSSALFGALCGAALVGKPCERFGRVKVLFVLAALYLISVIGCTFAWSVQTLMVFRFIGGLAVGGSSVVSPIYITEITPPAKRGVLVAISQLNIVVGILAALISNYVIAETVGLAIEAEAWRWMFGAEGVPALLFLICVLYIPESPRWLAHRGRQEEALATLKRLGYEDAEDELARINSSPARKAGVPSSLFQRRYLKPMLLVLALAAFNQLDGINAILYYVTDIFRMAGFADTDAFKQSAVVGAVNLVFTILGMVLIDRIGRRMLLLIGSLTFILSHALAAGVFLTGSGGWLAVLAAAGIVGSHAYSQGAVIWVCINELLPNAIRATGSSAACFTLWGLAIVVSTAFPILMASWGGFVFLFFAAMMALQFLIVAIFLPETKGKSLEEIEQSLSH
jgi:sugar porter (SP) family MFS transporter